jgi:hypothetical protein
MPFCCLPVLRRASLLEISKVEPDGVEGAARGCPVRLLLLDGCGSSRKPFVVVLNSMPKGARRPLMPNLMFCPDCGKEISRRAKTCIHCGCPISEILKSTSRINNFTN